LQCLLCPVLITQQRGRVGLVVGELDTHRADGAFLEALPGEIGCGGIVVLPSGRFG
jgi:hypothetical protein